MTTTPNTEPQGIARPSADRPVYLFCHIPKCAGTTVKTHMDVNAPERTVRAKRRHGLLRDFGGDYTDIERSEIDPDRHDFVGGHSLSGSVAAAFRGRPIRPLVLLRDPLSFAVSFYNHRNRNAAKDGRGPVPFELYIKSLPKNPMLRFILTRYLGTGYPKILLYDSRQRFDLVDKALAEFWFVGAWLHASELLAGLSREMDIPGEARVGNVARGERLRVGDVPDSVADRVRSINKADQLLFDRWGDVKWSQAPRDLGRDLPRGDQAAYVANEIGRQVFNRYIRAIRGKVR